MADEKPYIPLSERLKQDVWHDNFVPKYSAIPSARPSRLVLIGVWLIFGPMILLYVPLMFTQVQDARDLPAAFVSLALEGCMLAISVAILYQQTRRYFRARRSEDEPDED